MIIRPETQYMSPLRISRGTKLSDIPNDPPPKLSDIDSAFHIAEYLALLLRHDPHDVHSLVAIPEGSKGVTDNDKNLWIYEHLRRIPVDLTVLVTSLLGRCTSETCPQMKADEWQYLCTAHGNEGTEECSAIDYILHTLDSTTALLTFPEVFPSRITISQASTAHFQPLFRRLSRIFSHAYYSHREQFQLAEVETSLYARFVALCEKYELVTPNLLPIPRSVVVESLDGATPEEEDEEEDEDEEDEEEDRSRSREKGEGGRRPHSLDRHARPHKLEDLRQGTVKGWSGDKQESGEKQEVEVPVEEQATSTEKTSAPAPSTSTSSTTATKSDSKDSIDNEKEKEERQKALKAAFDNANSSSTSQAESTPAPMSTEPKKEPNPDPISLNTTQTYSLKPRQKKDKSTPKIQLPPHGTGTLGRGKKGRGTMLWTSDSSADQESIPEGVNTPTIEEPTNLERTESIETAILAPEDLDGEGPVPPSLIASELGVEKEEEKEEEIVGKDEIELLEEEGVLEPLPTTSPVLSTIPIETNTTPEPTTTEDIISATATTEIEQEKVDNIGKVEKGDEIEKGIENLDEIKDEEQVILPATLDLIDSTPSLGSPTSSNTDSDTGADSIDPKPDLDAPEKENVKLTSTSETEELKSDVEVGSSATEQSISSKETKEDSKEIKKDSKAIKENSTAKKHSTIKKD